VLEISTLLHLIDRLYVGALDAELWEAAIVGLSRVLGCEAGALPLWDLRGKSVQSITFIDIDENYRSSYADLTRLPDMRGAFCALADNARSGVLTEDELVSAAPGFGRSRFHGEWLQPQRLLNYLAAPLAPSTSVIGALFIGQAGRAKGYGDRELDGLRALRPHLVRAVQVRLRLDGAASAAEDALAALDLVGQGVLLVDEGAGVVHAN
jgi:hypothetical protein